MQNKVSFITHCDVTLVLCLALISAPEDYQAINESITFALADDEFNITLTIVPDTALEEDEQFTLVLSVPMGEPVDILQPVADVNILNDDG